MKTGKDMIDTVLPLNLQSIPCTVLFLTTYSNEG